jgi:hypothetical protein
MTLQHLAPFRHVMSLVGQLIALVANAFASQVSAPPMANVSLRLGSRGRLF